MPRQRDSHGAIAALFAIGFVVLIAVLAVLDYYGLPERVLGASLAGALTLALLGLSVSGGTLQASEFYLAGRAISPGRNGTAMAAAVVSGLVFLGIGGAALSDPHAAVALILGLALGFLALAILVAPYVRKSAAFGIVDFLGACYGGRGVRLAAGVAVIVAMLMALAASIAGAAFALGLIVGLSAATCRWIVVALVLAAVALGGLRSVTRTALPEYVVAALAIVLPVAVASLNEFGWPLPWLTFGVAAKQASLLAFAAGADLAPPPAPWFGPITEGAGALAALIVLAAGVACFPPLVMRSASATSATRARQAAGWGLIAVLIVALTAPAYPAFARLFILRELIDTPLEQLPSWVFTFGQAGLVRICGVSAASAIDAISACSALPGFTGNLRAKDIAVSGDAVVLAGPAIMDLPFVASALIAAGAFAAMLAAAKASAMALAATIGHDLYAGALDARASAGRQLVVTRAAAVVGVLVAGWMAAVGGLGTARLAWAALALTAAALFAPTVAAVWWKRANAYGAVSGIITGGIITGTLIAELRFPGFLPFGRLGVDELTAGIFGLPLSFAAVIAGSLATEDAGETRARTIDAIRQPGGPAFVQETESR